MATGKVARRTAVSDVAGLLDSPEVAALYIKLDALGDPRGRKGYGARALLGACLVKALFNLPTWTWVAALIAEHPGLQASLGGKPSMWAMYRFARKLRENHPALAECVDACAASLREQYPDFGRDVAIDASDLPAYANGQRYVFQGGRERERFSDPDASWGHRSAVGRRQRVHSQPSLSLSADCRVAATARRCRPAVRRPRSRTSLRARPRPLGRTPAAGAVRRTLRRACRPPRTCARCLRA